MNPCFFLGAGQVENQAPEKVLGRLQGSTVLAKVSYRRNEQTGCELKRLPAGPSPLGLQLRMLKKRQADGACSSELRSAQQVSLGI